MAFPTDWDVNEYRNEFECEEHWEMRKKFLETHKTKFAEDQLVCLAQVFINVELLGCKYPEETMRLVAELSEDIAKDFRETRAKRLKRTFVEASDAAEQKAKGNRGLKNTKTDSTNDSKEESKEINNENNESNNNYAVGLSSKFKAASLKDSDDEDYDKMNRPSFSGLNKSAQNPLLENNYWNPLNKNCPEEKQQSSGFFIKTLDRPPVDVRLKNLNLFENLRYDSFILVLTGDRHCIMNSARKCGVKYNESDKISPEGERVVQISLNNHIVGEGKANSVKGARKLAFDKAVKHLQSESYTIKCKTQFDKIIISRNKDTITACVEISTEDMKLDKKNVGYQMMVRLGWKGGSLGVRSKGIEEPIENLTVKNNRKGLGSSNEEINKGYFKKLLMSYIQSEDIRDLCFESSFTKDERAVLHQFAAWNDLKASSYGKGDDRSLIIKKVLQPKKILTEILINKNKMYMKKFDVKVPTKKRILFPEYADFQEADIPVISESGDKE